MRARACFYASDAAAPPGGGTPGAAQHPKFQLQPKDSLP